MKFLRKLFGCRHDFIPDFFARLEDVPGEPEIFVEFCSKCGVIQWSTP